jgi:hypothetical protein
LKKKNSGAERQQVLGSGAEFLALDLILRGDPTEVTCSIKPDVVRVGQYALKRLASRVVDVGLAAGL